jgi:hypothetical protein
MLYDAFEVQHVAEYPDPNGGTFCEPIMDEKDFNDDKVLRTFRTFWTLYGHRPEGGVNALIDDDSRGYIMEHYEFFTNILKRAGLHR